MRHTYMKALRQFVYGMSYIVDKDGYENAVKSFWRDFDKKLQ